MGKPWEIRGLFGNELAMEEAIEELKGYKGYEWIVLDRRNLSVRFSKRSPETEEVVKRALEIHHGYVESEAPLGEYDAGREAERLKKVRKEERKKSRSH